MYRNVLIFFFCVYAVQVETTFQDCGSKVGHYTKIIISDCKESEQSCILKKETNATIAIEFDVGSVANTVTAVVHGIVAGVPVPFRISHPDGCKNSGLTCPLEKEKGPYTYTNSLYVEKAYPTISLKVKWELKNEKGEDIVCVEIPAKIK